jgi:Mono-functional DNA-alkylating methyl methanesulfonate N-term
LYKITIEHEEEEVKALKIKYFDTVPIASALCILKSGFLFVASEFGNQCVVLFLVSASPTTLSFSTQTTVSVPETG